MGVEPKIGGKHPKWMVKIMENLIKMDDLGGGGVPPIFGNTHMIPAYSSIVVFCMSSNKNL